MKRPTKEMRLIVRLLFVSFYIGMTSLIMYGFQTIKPMSPFFLIGSTFMILMMGIPVWSVIEEWMILKKGGEVNES